MSRPWKVGETGSRRSGERPTSTASATPPSRSQTGISSPLSGPDQQPVLLDGAHGDRAAPARAAGADARVDDREDDRVGQVGERGAQHDRAGVHVVAGDRVGQVDHPRLGQRRAITAWQTPTNSLPRP